MASIPGGTYEYYGQGYEYYGQGKKTMYFSDLPVTDRIAYTKREFATLVRSIFEHPETLKTMIVEKKLSNDQSKIILKLIHKLNSKTCVCCRRFDVSKLQMSPVEKDFEPLLDIAQENVKTKTY